MASFVLKCLAGLFFATNYKALPLAYYFRFYYYAIKHIILPYLKLKLGLKPDVGPLTYAAKHTLKHEKVEPELAAFTPTVLTTYNSALECDMYLHKSNSCYFEELDIARTEAMCVIFQKLFLHFLQKKGAFVYVPVGAIQAAFKKEIKPFERYQILTRVFSWDEKWLFVMSKWILPGQKNRTSCIALTKYVLKDGRKTIPPAEALNICGLWSEKVEKIAKKNYPIVKDFTDTGNIQDVEMYSAEAKHIS